MNEKDPTGRERTKRLDYRGSQDHGHTLQERQGTVLTNQCLDGKEQMLSEELRNPSFPREQ